ncbi:MAG: AarF/UbiB family protein [Desulfocapsaceae bacterium]|nr:AarF/UbiB family protein [Desulfocapsaceae bacterium]
MNVDTKTLFTLLTKNTSRKETQRLLHHAAENVDKDTFRRLAAAEIIARIELHKIIPETYQRYRQLTVDGVEFFLTRVAFDRLLILVENLLALGPKINSEALLIETARHFPTLHKLCQVIARNPHLDERVKKWLIVLENGQYGTSVETLLQQEKRPSCSKSKKDIPAELIFAEEILSEASVAAVVGFQYTPVSSTTVKGVCKILKPAIPAILEEELQILAEIAVVLENSREKYDLQELNINALFEDLRQSMRKEINLRAEQEHLKEAEKLYRKNKHIRIPKVYSLSTPEMTCMEHLPGEKITQVDVPPRIARNIAKSLFEALICIPLYSTDTTVLFHGDPHAGNILLYTEPDSEEYWIGLVDWTLAGRLTLEERVRLSQLVQAVIKRNSIEIASIVGKLANQAAGSFQQSKKELQETIHNLLHSKQYQNLSLISTVFNILEELSYMGLVFRADLMLFRKSLFTLEGVLLDICPDFNIDTRMIDFVARRITEELPIRFNNLFFPFNDVPENYASLMTNMELQSLLFHQYSTFLFANTATLWGVSTQNNN